MKNGLMYVFRLDGIGELDAAQRNHIIRVFELAEQVLAGGLGPLGFDPDSEVTTGLTFDPDVIASSQTFLDTLERAYEAEAAKEVQE